MKKFTLLISALLAGAGAFANEENVMSNLTLAAAEIGATQTWAAEKTEIAPTNRLEKSLEDKAQALNDAINAKLEKALDEKLNRELQY